MKCIAVVIDDSFNLTSRRFCAMGPSGLISRFARVWAQDAAACGQGIMPYGRLLDANEISKLANAVAAGAAEEEVLREAGLISGHGADYLPDPMRSRVSHGTHVADLFAVAGHVAHAQIAAQIPRDRIGFAVPSIA